MIVHLEDALKALEGDFTVDNLFALKVAIDNIIDYNDLYSKSQSSYEMTLKAELNQFYRFTTAIYGLLDNPYAEYQDIYNEMLYTVREVSKNISLEFIYNLMTDSKGRKHKLRVSSFLREEYNNPNNADIDFKLKLKKALDMLNNYYELKNDLDKMNEMLIRYVKIEDKPHRHIIKNTSYANIELIDVFLKEEKFYTQTFTLNESWLISRDLHGRDYNVNQELANKHYKNILKREFPQYYV
jgi:hypothetical protein